MKRIAFMLVLALGISFSGLSNVVIPKAYISEVFVDTNGSWTIELGFVEFFSYTDSIWVETSSGSALVTSYDTVISVPGNFFDTLVLITNSNLSAPLSIDMHNDILTVSSHLAAPWSGVETHELVFGSNPVPCIQEGESICTIVDGSILFCINKVPSLGEANTLSTCTALVNGTIYDASGNPFPEGVVTFRGIMGSMFGPEFTTDANGQFSDDIPARKYGGYASFMYPGQWGTFYFFQILGIDTCFRPDETYSLDIQTDAVITGTRAQNLAGQRMVTVFPNPFDNKVKFLVDFPIEKIGDECQLQIFGLDGKVVFIKPFNAKNKTIEWSPGEHVPAGIYTYQLMQAGEILQSGKLIRK